MVSARCAPAAVAFAVVVVLLVSLAGAARGARGSSPAATAVTITQFSFNPPTINSGSQTTGTVHLSGGTPPYYLWFNFTPPGCNPASTPVSSISPTFSFNCQPSSTGTYSIRLDVADSSAPPSRSAQFSSLTVTSSNGNGNGNGSKNGGNNSGFGSLLPGGFLQIALILVLVVIVSMVVTAVGVVALAILVPRRLRQINETLTKSALPPKEPKPPA